MKERVLVAFTILAQAAVGTFWALGLVYFLVARETGPYTAEALTERGFLVVVALMVLALAASFLHLGTPLLAWRALGNLRSSWLSREVWSTVLFTGASALWAALLGFDRGTPLVRSIAFWAAAALGLALLLGMSWAYRLRTVPAWNSWVTPVSFVTTALLLGGLAAGVLVEVWPLRSGGEPTAFLQGLPVGTILLLGVEFLFLPLWLAGLADSSAAGRNALARLTHDRGALFKGRLVLMIAGVGLAGAQFIPPGTAGLFLLGPTLGVVLAAEGIGRVLFFAAYDREGV